MKVNQSVNNWTYEANKVKIFNDVFLGIYKIDFVDKKIYMGIENINSLPEKAIDGNSTISDGSVTFN